MHLLGGTAVFRMWRPDAYERDATHPLIPDQRSHGFSTMEARWADLQRRLIKYESQWSHGPSTVETSLRRRL